MRTFADSQPDLRPLPLIPLSPYPHPPSFPTLLGQEDSAVGTAANATEQ